MLDLFWRRAENRESEFKRAKYKGITMQYRVKAKQENSKLPLEKIADFDAGEQEWRVVPAEGDPQVVEI